MSYTIQNLKTDIESKMHGTSLNKIQSIEETIETAGRDIVSDVDPNGTIRQQLLANPLYDGVYDYVLPSDLKGKKIIDIQPQTNRGVSDNFTARPIEDFDLRKQNNTFNVLFNSGVKTLRASKATGKNLTISNLNTITDWTTGGDAENLAEDDLYKITGSGSLRLDLSGASTYGYIENSNLASLDMSDYHDQGAIFLWCYFPDSSLITGVNLRWGKDVSNYWDKTVTTNHEGNSFTDGWNLIRIDWNTASETGTPDSSDVDYVRVTINYDGTAKDGIRVDNIVARLGNLFNIVYYSRNLFQDATTGEWKETIGSDSDIVNLEHNELNLLVYKALDLVAQQQAGSDSQFDVNMYTNRYQTILKEYKKDNKSQAIKEQQQYYRI